MALYGCTNDWVPSATLDELRFASGATIDAQDPEGCMDGTRIGILDELKTWYKDPNGSRIFWLDGMAGTGKSAIARSFCHMLQSDGSLLGSFFCSRRGLVEQGDVLRILPTLSISLALRFPSYKWSLLSVLQKYPISPHANLQLQFKRLLESPCQKIFDDTAPTGVLVIDALDECSDEDAVSCFLEQLIAIESTVPFKFFLTSRPEPQIRTRLDTNLELRRVIRLHEVEQTTVAMDLKLYITAQLEAIRRNSFDDYPPDWPSSEAISKLTLLSGNLFIYAFTAKEYIKVNPVKRLETLMNAASVTDRPLVEPLDAMYSFILQEATDPRKYTADEILATKEMLLTVVSLLEPVSISTLAELMSLSRRNIRFWLNRLHAVISVPRHDEIGVISTFHASFGDFLTTPGRAPDGVLVKLSDGHQILAQACIRRMDALCFNIAKCPSSYLPNSKQTLEHIPQSLLYACVSCVHHTQGATDSQTLLPSLVAVFMKKFLFWLEVLSATCTIHKGQEIVNLLSRIYTDVSVRMNVRLIGR